MLVAVTGGACCLRRGGRLCPPDATAAPWHKASLVQREVSRPLAVTEGLSPRADVGIRPYTRLSSAYAYPSGRTESSAPTHVYRQRVRICFGRMWALPPTNVSSGKMFSNWRPKAATYLCRFAAKARFDNRHTPRGEVSKGESIHAKSRRKGR